MAAATSPWRIPASGWKTASVRVKDEIKIDHLPIVAAGMAFWAMLALFPTLIAVVSLYGLVADPAAVEQQVDSMSRMLPASASQIVETQMRDIVRSSGAALGFGFVLSLVAALWSASAGIGTAMKAINIAYDRKQERGFLKDKGIALLLTLGAVVLVIAVLFLIAVLPALFGLVGLGGAASTAIAWLRWPVLALLVIVALAVLYRVAPVDHSPPWRWVAVGAVAATLVWLGMTALFSTYVSNFGSYNETYGALGGVIVLLLWFFLSSFVILLGAELNAELERQVGRLPQRAEKATSRASASPDTVRGPESR